MAGLRLALVCCLLGALNSASLWGAAEVIVRFDPGSPEIGPFPTDALTVAEPNQKTGRRVHLPMPDCGKEPSACEDVAILNQYDGFSLLPRVRVRFSGPVDVDTLRRGIFFVALDDVTGKESGRHPRGKTIPVNQLVYDPTTDTTYAEADELLDQHRQYALVVTDFVRDRAGNPVATDPEFRRCLDRPSSSYCNQLAREIHRLEADLGLKETRLVGASVFTTLAATAWMEKARDLLPQFPPRVELARPKHLFAVSSLDAMIFRRQTRANPAAFEEAPVRTDLLEGVDRIAFASYRSPKFLDSQQQIAITPSGTSLAPPSATHEIFFHIFLPASAKPRSGYPVVIGSHGSPANRFGCVFANGLSGSLAREGLAFVASNAVGFGFGPEGRVILKEKDGTTTELPAGGRAVDLDGDGVFGATEGCRLPGAVGSRDCLRQTALDLMQLARAVRAGIDLDEDGTSDLDPNRIYFFGHSFAAAVGAILTAIEPSIAAATLNVGPGATIEAARWVSDRTGVAEMLALRKPSPLNKGKDFDESYVLRDQPVKVNDVPGAIDIQNVLETFEWIRMPGDPMAYAPHLRASPLAGVPPKRVLFQFARGDQGVPNPTSSAFIRAAGMREWAILYRHDLARAAVPELPADPHAFEENFGKLSAATIARASQTLTARFLAGAEGCGSDEPCIPDVSELLRPTFSVRLFEGGVLPEDLGYLGR